MSKTVNIGGLRWLLSKWCRKEIKATILDATQSIVSDLAHEIEEMLAEAHGVDKASLVDTVSIVRFIQSDVDHLWLDVRASNWQNVIDWAICFAEFTGELNGVCHKGVRVEWLLRHKSAEKAIDPMH
jgi:hypothetical protein